MHVSYLRASRKKSTIYASCLRHISHFLSICLEYLSNLILKSLIVTQLHTACIWFTAFISHTNSTPMQLQILVERLTNQHLLCQQWTLVTMTRFLQLIKSFRYDLLQHIASSTPITSFDTLPPHILRFLVQTLGTEADLVTLAWKIFHDIILGDEVSTVQHIQEDIKAFILSDIRKGAYLQAWCAL